MLYTKQKIITVYEKVTTEKLKIHPMINLLKEPISIAAKFDGTACKLKHLILSNLKFIYFYFLFFFQEVKLFYFHSGSTQVLCE